MKKFDQGGCAKIYLANNTLMQEKVVIKINSNAKMNNSEFHVMRHMNNKKVEGFPKVHSKGTYQNQPYIILEQLGPSAHDLLKRRKKLFSIKCVLSIGLQILDLLEKLHDQGFLHGDLKPDNVLTGNSAKNPNWASILYLIDFGFAQRFKNKEGEHVELKEGQPFNGNLLFTSKNAFKDIT